MSFTDISQNPTAGFLARYGWADAAASPLDETGASHRKYLRLTKAAGETAILVFAHGPAIEIVRFTELSEFLRGMRLSAPEVYAADIEAKLMLQEDFGNDSYNQLIARGAAAQPLILQAVDVLLAIQSRFDAAAPLVAGLPRYDFTRWQKELQNFHLHYLPCAGRPALSDAEQAEYGQLWQAALAPCDALPPTLLMRDFKPANLMRVAERTGLAATGIIDFQDAGLGAPFYDLVELTQSWRRPVPPDLREAVIARYAAGRPDFTREQIEAGIMTFGAVRWIAWLSTCARYAREGRTQFLANIPGIWAAADLCLANPALIELKRWFAVYAPHEARAPVQVAA